MRLAIPVFRRAVLGMAGGIAATWAAPAMARPADCAVAQGMGFVCGTGAVEDLAVLPGGRWLIGGNLNIGSPARLRLIDGRTRALRDMPVTVAGGGNSGCAPPDVTRWSMSGLAVAAMGVGRFRLFVTNHGDRHAVEVLDGRMDRAGVTLAWRDCVAMPAGALANAVAAVSPDAFYVTSFHDPDDVQAWAGMARGEPTGSVWLWQAGKGLRQVKAGPISGANGVELSADRRWLYVSGWGERAIWALDLRHGMRRRIAVDFLPDNIHLIGNDLLVAGQVADPAAIGACGAQCPQPWRVVRLNPRTGRQRVLARGQGSGLVNYACGAVAQGRRVWITLRGDDRVGHIPRRR
ncbi:hypothetical protein GTZ99_06185 [Novosphingobium sp. FSY-8]|uniref:SMP-30/Gluconolactonase/LRE-like region domain-containing protein n=1 Tax=Novosphingobium ovatum TaxID=1908523 RepID=A0ABW9XC97_9SPHN|nr:hypothetical protein [Novosphingobium ovatum]NBC36144.1 hypothetical protein [Novosphingobium ovatum]